MSPSPRPARAGFTLVELSIVLVILGLLVGGVLTGQSLIHAAELRTVTTQAESYATAVNTFKGKYFALPGDMTNATQFWVAAAAGASCATTQGTGTQTCDGDGNGKIDISANSNELFRFWQHLGNAGLVEGNFTGIPVSGSYGTNNTNVPISKISSGLWFVFNWGTETGADTGFFNGQYDNGLELGALMPGQAPEGPLLKPEDAYNIDMKTDDGKPATGRLVVHATLSNCTDQSATTALTANYKLSSTTPACAIVFRQAF